MHSVSFPALRIKCVLRQCLGSRTPYILERGIQITRNDKIISESGKCHKENKTECGKQTGKRDKMKSKTLAGAKDPCKDLQARVRDLGFL